MNLSEELLQFKYLLDEAEGVLVDDDTDISNAKSVNPSQDDSEDDEEDQEQDNSTGTQLAIFDEQGFQTEVTPEFTQCFDYIKNLYTLFMNTYNECMDEWKKTPDQYMPSLVFNKLNDLANKGKDAINQFISSEYTPKCEKMTISEQKTMEELLQRYTTIIECLHEALKQFPPLVTDSNHKEVKLTGEQTKLLTTQSEGKDFSAWEKAMFNIAELLNNTKGILAALGAGALVFLNNALKNMLTAAGYPADLLKAFGQYAGDKLRDSALLKNFWILLKNGAIFGGKLWQHAKEAFKNGLKTIFGKIGSLLKELDKMSAFTYLLANFSFAEIPIKIVGAFCKGLIDEVGPDAQRKRKIKKLQKRIKEAQEEIQDLNKQKEKLIKDNPKAKELESEIKSIKDVIPTIQNDPNKTDEYQTRLKNLYNKQKQSEPEVEAINDKIKTREDRISKLQKKIDELSNPGEYQDFEKIKNPKDALKDIKNDIKAGKGIINKARDKRDTGFAKNKADLETNKYYLAKDIGHKVNMVKNHASNLKSLANAIRNATA